MGQVHESADPIGGEQSHERWSTAVLVISFIASFTFACGVLLMIGHYGLHAPRSLWPFGAGSITPRGQALEPSFTPFTVSRGGAYIKAAVGDSGNPTKGEDYTFFIWFKLRKAPAPGEVLGLVGKFDSQGSGRPGYAVSLEGAPDGIRPRVYLGTGESPGRWYSFSSYPMNRRDWYLLTFSITHDTFVSTSLGRAFSKEAPVLLGGHRIGDEGLPASRADLVVGAFGASRFRGQIGPFGVLSGTDLAKELPSFLGKIQQTPGAPLADIPKQTIRVWASPAEDLGPRKVAIVHAKGDTRDVQEMNAEQSVQQAEHIGSKKTQKRLTPPKKTSGKKKAAKAATQQKK